MTPASTVRRLLVGAAIFGLAASQTTTAVAAQTTAASSTSSEDLIQSLIAGAESLISSVYPSTTVTNIATLTFPSTVVIGGSTYAVNTGSSTAAATPTSSSSLSSVSSQTTALSSSSPISSPSQSSDTGDKRLGIILGAVLGFVALALLVVILVLVHRRRRQTGTFLKHQSQFNEGDIESWKSPDPTWQDSNARWNDKYAQLNTSQAPMAVPIAAVSSPAAVRSSYASNPSEGHWSADNGSGNPFWTPHDSRSELANNERHGSSVSELAAAISHRNSTSSSRLQHSRSRHSASFAPAPVDTSPVSPVSPVPRQYEYGPVNPFASREDLAANGFVPPSIPMRSPERRHSPQVFYPPGSEVENFNFGMALRQYHEQQHQGWAGRPSGDGRSGRGPASGLPELA